MQWDIIWDYRSTLAEGLCITLQLSAVGIVGSTLLGISIGSCAAAPNFYVRKLVSTYIEVLRNIPLLVKLFFIYFGTGLSEMPAAILALTLHQSAYIAEVMAAGLRGIPPGQTEAAFSMGHGRAHTFWYILMPQALRSIIPPLTTQFVQVVKNSSVVMLISVVELTGVTRQIESDTLRGFEAATAVSLIYLAIALVIVTSMNKINRTINRKWVR